MSSDGEIPSTQHCL